MFTHYAKKWHVDSFKQTNFSFKWMVVFIFLVLRFFQAHLIYEYDVYKWSAFELKQWKNDPESELVSKKNSRNKEIHIKQTNKQQKKYHTVNVTAINGLRAYNTHTINSALRTNCMVRGFLGDFLTLSQCDDVMFEYVYLIFLNCFIFIFQISLNKESYCLKKAERK